MNKIRVLLADDQRIILDGLKALLEMNTLITVVDMADNGESAYEKTLKIRPDVVLMDIRMPKMDGVEATRLIKRDAPETVVIMLTTFDDDEYIIKAMTYGASGYLLKDIGSEKLIEAIMDGMSGSIILPGNVAAKITSRLNDDASSGITMGDFTQRELDIISLMMKGMTNREISEDLYLSIGTVKNYISQIYLKIDVNDRAKAVLQLKRMGF
ncbi:MAG: response regulator transcription factor [Gudongella sp.]|nr:response regulator transcription factor [Gudongella sp.]